MKTEFLVRDSDGGLRRLVIESDDSKLQGFTCISLAEPGVIEAYWQNKVYLGNDDLPKLIAVLKAHNGTVS